MPARFFGEFLLEKGAITKEMLLDAVNYQKSINNPLCALALEHGYLSKEQVKALDEEHLKSDKKFLEIALAKRMLTFKQLEELGKIRSEKWLFLGEALVQRKHLKLARLQDLFAEYSRERTSSTEKIPGVELEGIHEQAVVASLLKVTVDIFVHYSRQIVKVVSVEETSSFPKDAAYLFTQRVFGDKNFVYMLALPEALTLAIASYVLQQPVKQVDNMAMDAVSEFVNIVVGNGCAKLSMNHCKVSAEPPRIVPKEMLSKVLAPLAVSVKMKTTKGEFVLVFAFGVEEEGKR